MAIDPRISLAIKTPDTMTNAINIFENALNSASNRAVQEQNIAQSQQRMAQADVMNPLLAQQAQQGVDVNAQNIAATRNEARFKDILQTSQQLKPFIANNDAVGAERFILKNISRLQDAKARGEDVDLTESLETLEQIKAGNLQGVAQNITAIESIAQQRAGQLQKTRVTSSKILADGTTVQSLSTGGTNVISAAGDLLEGPDRVNALNKSLGVEVTQVGDKAQAKSDVKVDETGKIESIKTTEAGKTSAIKAGLKVAEKAFEKMPQVRTAILNYDEAIAALDAGAETGTIKRLLPSLSAAGKNLDNTIKRLGLDVVGNTTFGALSESELAFALQAAIPDNLEPVELKKWLTAKKNAQQSILSGLDEISTFMGDGTKTITDWKNKQAIDKLSAEQGSNTQRTGGVIMTDANGNRATVYPDGTFEEL